MNRENAKDEGDHLSAEREPGRETPGILSGWEESKEAHIRRLNSSQVETGKKVGACNNNSYWRNARLHVEVGRLCIKNIFKLYLNSLRLSCT